MNKENGNMKGKSKQGVKKSQRELESTTEEVRERISEIKGK